MMTNVRSALPPFFFLLLERRGLLVSLCLDLAVCALPDFSGCAFVVLLFADFEDSAERRLLPFLDEDDVFLDSSAFSDDFLFAAAIGETMKTIEDIRQIMNRHFPVQGAEDWDNPGLQLGRSKNAVQRVILALELTPDIVKEAIDCGAQLILTHHPFIFKPFKALNDDSADGRMLLDLAEAHIGLLAAHTNLDSAPQAINEKLANDLNLSDRAILLPHEAFAAYKIVVFVPEQDADAVAEAMHRAGAGCVGNYSDVSFRGHGTGCFACGSDSHPAIGKPGSVERVPEARIEMVVSARDLKAVTTALLKAHPYEEPAYDVFKLESPVHGMTDQYGFGMTGTLPKPITLTELLAQLCNLWQIDAIRASGDPDKIIRKVGIMNGSGARYVAKARGVDAYITGDCGHHDFDNANRLGIALIDAGHYDTEKFIPEIMRSTLASELGNEVELRIATSMRRPFDFYNA